MNSKNKLKFMTYNIHSGFGRDNRYRLNQTIEVIKHERPDIVALQEVDKNLSRSQHDDQSQLISESLDMHYHHCVNNYVENGEYGITTLSRFPIMRKKRADLSFRPEYEPRGTLRTDIILDDDLKLHVFNVHLGLRTRERQHQVRKLLSDTILFEKDLQDPVVIMGDFNDKPLPVVHPGLRAHFSDVFELTNKKTAPTFRWGPVKFRLDHIYISDHLTPIHSYVVKNPTSLTSSDHLPVVAVIGLK